MLITVFTPTYNRRELLKRTYESLLRQDFTEFEWLIVDDGSEDDTESEVRKWTDEGKITIRYHYKENGGKMRAHNVGAMLAEGELFLCLDSDDYLVDDALSQLHSAYISACTKADDASVIGGVVAHKGKSPEELLGEKEFPETEVSTLYGLYLKGFSGETTLMYRTQLLKRFPFPEIDGEKYVPEDYIYDKIDSVCVLAVLNKIITVCEIVDSGYTDSVKKIRQENPKAWHLYYEQRSRITPFGILKIKYLGRYVIYSLRCSLNPFNNSEIGFWNVILGYLWAGVLLLTHKE